MHNPVWSPNADQQRAIETMNDFCIVLAGPGTGKTETLAAKVATILQQGGTPLAVTYTRAAAQELISRLGQLHERVTACTCHSLAFKLFLRLASTVSGCVPRLLDTRRHEREAVLRVVRRQCQRGLCSTDFASLSLVELGDRISVIKACGAATEEDRALVALYEAAKGRERMDFQDLLLQTTSLLMDNPAWRSQYQRLYSHVLVDEAQDLDPLQARFLSLFVDDALTVFLDPDQAIYSYAGAEPYTTLDLLGSHIRRMTIALRPSYRSRAPILTSALRLIGHNPNGHHARTLTPVRPGRLRPRWYRVASPAAEARLTAATIALLLQRGIAPTDILCLFRANAYRTMLEIELTRQQIPFRLLQGSREQQPTYLEYSVLPLTALLLQLADVHEQWIDEAALRIYVGTEMASRLAQRPAGTCLTEAADVLGERVQRGVAAYLRDYAELQYFGRHETPSVVADIAYRRLTSRARTPSDSPADLASAVAGCALFPSVAAFAEHITTLERFRALPAHLRVPLATIHKAKGRQSRIVFVVGAAEGVLPPTHPGTDIAEERRICFVGVTRAKDLLIVSAPRQIAGMAAPVSRFIGEGKFQRLFFPTPHRIAGLLDRV
jgi:DNA helicase II / ATP-dependent DNA helicase PcrA